MLKASGILNWGEDALLSVEVPDRFVVVEGETVGRTVLGQDVHDMREAPRLLRQPDLIVALALAVLPGIWIDGRAAKAVGRLQQVGRIVQACVAKLTFFV